MEIYGIEGEGEGTEVSIRDIIDQGCFSFFITSTFIFLFFAPFLFQYYSLFYLSIYFLFYI